MHVVYVRHERARMSPCAWHASSVSRRTASRYTYFIVHSISSSDLAFRASAERDPLHCGRKAVLRRHVHVSHRSVIRTDARNSHASNVSRRTASRYTFFIVHIRDPPAAPRTYLLVRVLRDMRVRQTHLPRATAVACSLYTYMYQLSHVDAHRAPLSYTPSQTVCTE